MSCGTSLPGQGLKTGRSLASCDGRVALQLGSNSDLVPSFGATPPWSSNTTGRHGAAFTLLPDGDATLYATGGVPIVDTWTTGLPSARLLVQNDGNLVVHDAAGTALFATDTCCH